MEFAEPAVQVAQVPRPESDGGAGKGAGREGQALGVSAHRQDRPSSRLGQAASQHGKRKVGAHHLASEAPLPRQFQRQVEGAGAGVQEQAVGRSLPTQRAHRPAAPPAVDVEAEQVVEQVVPGRDLAEQRPNLGGPFPSGGGLRAPRGGSRFALRGQGQLRVDEGISAHHGDRRKLNKPVPSDKTLAAKASAGQEKAFRELMTRYEKPVFSLVYRMVRDRGLAEDLAQETFIRAFTNIRSYNPSYKFSSWIFKIAHNLTIDHLRKKQIETVSIHGAPDAITEEEQARTSLELEDTGELPDAYVENLELGSQIERAVGQLRPEYRTATLLRHVEGYSYQEIAKIMDLPLGTVKTYIHRARLELKEALADVERP